MPTETDMRLRSWLDANQRDREQMCRSVLELDPHYTEVKPRHPMGGRDGRRDIDAVFDGQFVAYGAVGFANGANNSKEQKKTIRKKFSDDLASALNTKPDLKIFAFLTNLHFTMGEQTQMKKEARKRGIEHCDVLERERLRIALDLPSGFFIRFQYLDIPLSRLSRQASSHNTAIVSRRSSQPDFRGSTERSIASFSFRRLPTYLTVLLFDFN